MGVTCAKRWGGACQHRCAQPCPSRDSGGGSCPRAGGQRGAGTRAQGAAAFGTSRRECALPGPGGRARAAARTGAPLPQGPAGWEQSGPRHVPANRCHPGRAAAALTSSRRGSRTAPLPCSQGTPAGQGGPSARARHHCCHQHPKRQLPGPRDAAGTRCRPGPWRRAGARGGGAGGRAGQGGRGGERLLQGGVGVPAPAVREHPGCRREAERGRPAHGGHAVTAGLRRAVEDGAGQAPARAPRLLRHKEFLHYGPTIE